MMKPLKLSDCAVCAVCDGIAAGNTMQPCDNCGRRLCETCFNKLCDGNGDLDECPRCTTIDHQQLREVLAKLQDACTTLTALLRPK